MLNKLHPKLHAGTSLHAVNAAYHQSELADFCRQSFNATCGLTIQTAWSCVYVCLQVLHTGEISEQAPIPVVTESVLRSSELREGTTVSLDQQVTCSVAFAKGQERRVFFAVQGLPQVCTHPQISPVLLHLHPVLQCTWAPTVDRCTHLHPVLQCTCAHLPTVGGHGPFFLHCHFALRCLVCSSSPV